MVPLILTRPSKSANLLKIALGTKFKKWHTPVKRNILNWGCSHGPPLRGHKIYNSYAAVAIACNKLNTFEVLKGQILIPNYTIDIEQAKTFGRTLCRNLYGSGGKGIILAHTSEELVKKPIYVQYIKKIKEYRVHVFYKTIDIEEKKRRYNKPDNFNKYIRSYNNGWVFCRENINPPIEIGCLAEQTIKLIGLDFGAVDIILGYDGELYVLEVNTAPGLQGTTLDKYVIAIREVI